MKKMENPKPISQVLAEIWSETNSEPEPDILTEDEKIEAISNAIEHRKHIFRWRFENRGIPKLEVETKMLEIDWLKQIDPAYVLQIANSSKHYAIWEASRREQERNEAKEKYDALVARWTAKEFLHFMRYVSKAEFKKDLVINEYTLPIIKTICFFLSNDPRFETELGYSFDKGLWFRGPCGIGKTYLAQLVANNPLSPINMKSMIEIADCVRMEGDYELIVPAYRKIYIDDVGSEPNTVNNYGNKVNWFKNYMEAFYFNNPGQYNRLIVSTNHSHAEIEEKYGFRFRSRMKDMFNVVEVFGEDLRG